MNEEEKKYGVILSALLYDIGKFIYQAQPSAETPPQKLGKEFFEKEISNKFCVTPIKEYVLKILSGEGEGNFTSILKAEEIFEKEEKLKTIGEANAYPLLAAFSKVDFQAGKELPQKIYGYYPRKLSLDNEGQEIFPIAFENGQSPDEITEEIKKLYESFKAEIKHLPDISISAFVDSLLFLYEKYLVYVNSSLVDKESDISLYDHAKTVAALSVCKEFSDDTEKPFLIVTADVSGIQSFIYAENESKSKRLRGRSFYVGLLTELFSDYLLEKFRLPRTNLLMNGGGHFVVILPNSQENRDKLSDFQREVQNWFYKNFKGDINLVIKSLQASDELYMNFPKWYNEISSKLIEGKKQKSVDNLNEIFMYDLDKMNVDEYKTTLTKEQLSEMETFPTEYERNQFILSSLFENIGKVLPKTKYITRIRGDYEKIGELNKKYNSKSSELFLAFQNFGVGYLFAEDMNTFLVKEKNNSLQAVRVLKLNDTDYLNVEERQFLEIANTSDYPLSIGFWFVGNYTPRELESENVLEFENIAKMNNEKDEEDLSYPLLGTLRMDVDNLGAIFSQGLEREKEKGGSIRTLSRTVSLSRQFNLFFGGYLNLLAKKWGVYITYSGGDDLFVVASWINALNFAVDVRRDFRKFVCENPYITISGGLTVHKHNFPIGRAAEQAGKAEEKAKKYSVEKSDRKKTVDISDDFIPEKNSFTAFDKSTHWEDFLKYFQFGKDLDFLVKNNNGLKASQVHFILQQTKQMFATDEEKTKTDSMDFKEYFRLLARIKYYAARNLGIKANDIEQIEQTDSERIKLLGTLISNIEYLENFVVPASYVVLKNRNKKKNTNQNSIKEN